MLSCRSALPFFVSSLSRTSRVATTAGGRGWTTQTLTLSSLSSSSSLCVPFPHQLSHHRMYSSDSSSKSPKWPPPPPPSPSQGVGRANAVPVDDILSILMEGNKQEMDSGIARKFSQLTAKQTRRPRPRDSQDDPEKDSIRRRKGRFSIEEGEDTIREDDDSLLNDLEELSLTPSPSPSSRRSFSSSLSSQNSSSSSSSSVDFDDLDDEFDTEEDDVTAGDLLDSYEELFPERLGYSLEPSDYLDKYDANDMKMTPDGEGRDVFEYIDSTILDELDDEEKNYLRTTSYKYLNCVTKTQEERSKYRMERAPLLEQFLREYSRRTSSVYRLIQTKLRAQEESSQNPQQNVPTDQQPSPSLSVSDKESPLKVNYNQDFGTAEKDPLDDVAFKYEKDLYMISDDTLSLYEQSHVPWKEFHVYAKHAVTLQYISNVCDEFDSALRRYFLTVQRYPSVLSSLKTNEYEREGGICLKYELLQEIAESKKEVFALLPVIEEWRKEFLHPYLFESNDRLRFLRTLSMNQFNTYDDLTTQIYLRFDALTDTLISAFNYSSELERTDSEDFRLKAEHAFAELSEVQREMGWEEWTGVNLNYHDFGKKMEIFGALRHSVFETQFRDLDWDLLLPRPYKFEKKYLKNSEYLVNRHQRKVQKWKENRKAAKQNNPLHFKRHDNLTEVHPLLLQIVDSVPHGKRRDIASMSARALYFNHRFNLREKVKALEEIASGLRDDFLLEHGMTEKEYAEAKEEAERFMRGEGEFVIKPDHPLFGDKPDPKHYVRGFKDASDYIRFSGKFKGDGGKWSSANE